MKLREKKSLILNMSSCSALKPLKNYFLYGASKVIEIFSIGIKGIFSSIRRILVS